MPFYPFPARHKKLFAVILFVALAVSGCEKKALPPPSPCTCGNITITVDHSKPRGVDKKATYLCPNYTITWVPGPHVQSFEVQFVGPDLPFGATTTFVGTTLPVTSPTLPDPGELTVFKYNLKIVDNNGHSHQFDPHVVGGGGL
jgi:hypothetical protein